MIHLPALFTIYSFFLLPVHLVPAQDDSISVLISFSPSSIIVVWWLHT